MRRYYWSAVLLGCLATLAGFAVIRSGPGGASMGFNLDRWYLWQLPVAAAVGAVLGWLAASAAPGSVLYRPRESAEQFSGRVAMFPRPYVFAAAAIAWTYGLVMAFMNRMVLLPQMARLQALALQEGRFWLLGIFAACTAAAVYGLLVMRTDWGGRHALTFGRGE